MNHISKKNLIGFAVALVVGLSLGNLGGRGGGYLIPNEGIALSLAGFVLVVLAFIAIVFAKQPDGNGGPAARTTMLVAGLFVAGFGGEWLRAAAVRPPQPVQLEASGTVRLTLDGFPDYTRQDEAPATCRSEFGSRAVSWIEAVRAGDLGTGAVYVSMSLFPDEQGMQPALLISVTPVVAASDAAPQWSGHATLVEGAVGDPTGRVTFSGVGLDGDPSRGPQSPWPLEIAGSLSWVCGDWSWAPG